MYLPNQTLLSSSTNLMLESNELGIKLGKYNENLVLSAPGETY
jgi:hypothetical protein